MPRKKKIKPNPLEDIDIVAEPVVEPVVVPLTAKTTVLSTLVTAKALKDFFRDSLADEFRQLHYSPVWKMGEVRSLPPQLYRKCLENNAKLLVE